MATPLRLARSALVLVTLAGALAGSVAASPAATGLRAVDVARGVVSREERKLDSRLRALVAPGPTAATRRSDIVPLPLAALRGAKAHVFVQLESAAAADLALLAQAGLKVERVSSQHRLVRGWVRTKDLQRLARLDVVRSVVPVRRAHLHAGSVTSEGDAAARAPQARATGFDGTGIMVGVISDGIDRVGLSTASGNVPAGTGVPAGAGCAAGSGDEGTAMLEIVHDLAPGATLRFSQGFTDKMAFIDSLTCLQDAGAQVIVDDLGFFDEPFFEDGIVAQAVRDVVNAGVSYHSAAGNAAAIHYGAPFKGSVDVASGGLYHSFAAGVVADTFDRVDVPSGGVIQCVLQWNDPWGGSANDYDLELWDLGVTPAVLIDASTSVQSGTQNPLEELGVLNQGASTGHVGIRVKRVTGVDRQLSLFCPGVSNLQYANPDGSIFGHPALTEVVAVGAIDIHDVNLSQVEPFSSQGPVTIYFPSLEVRDKPDLAGFDGVATSICPSPFVCFSPFFGTSAAAPHSAAVAALLLSKDSCLAPSQVQQVLTHGADDILALGFDRVSGAGRLDALNVLTAPDHCDDGDRCTRDTCTPQTGCQHTVLADGSSCADADLCNGTETCQAGICTPGTPLVCDDGNPCTTNYCNPATGCVSVDACNDGNPCTTDTCNPVIGCQHTPVPGGTACADADLCNGTETCQAGTCTAGTPLTCESGPECSGTACDPKIGCTYPPLAGFPGLACLCTHGLAPASCGSTTIPRAVVARFDHACNLVTRAAGVTGRRRAIKLLDQATHLLRQATKGTRRASKHGLPPDCASTLTAILDDTQGRALILSGTL